MDTEAVAKATTRVYSVVDIKDFDDDKREFTGIATSPATDRMDDIVEPGGAEYTLPISLLWQHDRMLPVGVILSVKSTSDGLEVRGSVAKVDSPPGLAARLEEAWQSLKHQLVRGLSIGFRPLEYAFMDNGGIHFTKWEWLELSLVTIPANSEATITAIKSIDDKQRAALGQKKPIDVVRIKTAGASAKPKPQEIKTMNIEEQIKGFQAARDEKSKRMKSIMESSGEEGRTLDAAESEEYDELEQEISAIDKQLDRLEKLKALDIEKAVPVQDQTGMTHRVVAKAKNTEKLEPGIGFARYARVKLLSQMDREPIERVAKTLYPNDDRLISVIKAPTEAANTMEAEWAGNLINESSTFGDFVEYLRPRTILGQVQSLLRQLPFDTPVLIQNSGGTGGWVKEGDAKPVTKWAYSRAKLAPLTVAAITAATKQQLMRASVAADALFRDELARAVGETVDVTFVDPSVQAVADESPGSIFNGVAGLTPHGDTGILGVRCDIATMMNAHNDANLNFDGLFWIMSGRAAIALSQMTNEIGNLAYPTVTPTGGTLAGFPVYVSNYAPTDSTGTFVALVKGSEIYFADEGGLDVAMSDQASLLMDTAPSMDSTTPAAAQMVSMFQTNSVAFRVERFLNWQRRRSQAVAWMSVGWDACQEVEG